MGTNTDFKYTFQKLTPTENADLKAYKEALDYVFEEKNKDVQNIAITGVYGSGKSSVINTYERLYNKRFIHISLTHFENNKNIESEEILEKKIVNQLVHQIPAKMIPDSNFRTKKPFSKGWTIYTSIRLVLLTLLLSYICVYYNIVEYLYQQPHQNLNKIFSLPVLIGVFVFSIIFLISLLYDFNKWQKRNHIISKISIKSHEMEFADNKNDNSYFNRHIDEILYVLESITNPTNTNERIDGIVIEDLDRFKDVDISIFEKLRELCMLGNGRIIRKSNASYQPLRFFYLLSDDTFLTTDRTKFFDYIIPIIPVVDSSNAYAKLKECLDSIDYNWKLNDSFLRKISIYFDDFRLMKNIINEFQIYAQKLNNIDHDYNILLAVIVYKNYFPKDYAQLQLRDGYVYNLFKKRNELEENITKEYKNEINSLKEQLNASNNNEYNKSEILKQINDFEHLIDDTHNCNFNELLTFNKNNDVFKIDIKSVDTNDNSTNKNIQEDKYFDLLKYLINSGYLNDLTYRDYIAYFDEYSMSIFDKNFLISLNNRDGRDFDYMLENVSLVYDYLESKDFLVPAIRNFDIIDYIIQNNSINDISSFMAQLQYNNDIEFVSKYLRQTSYYDKFIKFACEYWYNFLSCIISDTSQYLTDNEIQKIVFSALVNCTSERIKLQNESDVLTNYISMRIKDVDCDNKFINTIIDQMIILRVKIYDLDSQIINKELRREIINNNLYLLSISNINSILINELNCSLSDIREQYISKLLSSNDDNIKKYVMENLSIVVKSIVDNVKTQNDSQEIVLLVSSSGIDNELILDYLRISETVITNLNDINELYWNVLAEKHTFYESSNNVFLYFEKYKLDDYLVQFINKSNIEENTIFNDVPDNSNLFWNEAYINQDLSDDAYLNIVESIGKSIKSFSRINFDVNKIHILLNHRLIAMNTSNLHFFRKNYQTLTIEFIKTDVESYLNIVKDLSYYLLSEVEDILNDSEFSDDQKVKLLSYKNAKISVINKKLSDNIFENIITNHFNSDDIQYLLSGYDKLSDGQKKVVYNKFKSDINIITDSIEICTESFLERIFYDNEISLVSKANILDRLLNIGKSNTTIANLLVNAGEEMISRLFSQEKSRMSTLTNDEGHRQLLGVLKNHKIIDDYTVDDSGNNLKIKR